MSRRSTVTVKRRHRRLLLAGNVCRAACHPHHRRADRHSVNQIRRGGISESDFEKIKDYSIELQHIPLYVDETGGLSVAQLAARARRLETSARSRPAGGRLPTAAAGLDPAIGRKPRAGNHRNHHQAQGLGEGTELYRFWRCRNCRVKSKAATTSGPNSRICVKSGLDRAGRRRGAVRLSR